MINIEPLMPRYTRFLTNYFAREARKLALFGPLNTRLMLNSPALSSRCRGWWGGGGGGSGAGAEFQLTDAQFLPTDTLL